MTENELMTIVEAMVATNVAFASLAASLAQTNSIVQIDVFALASIIYDIRRTDKDTINNVTHKHPLIKIIQIMNCALY